MLELKGISKIYESNSFKQVALDKISISFRDNEFVSILGPSGSGKTTLLNIIGGLDNYTKGDLIINGVSTKKYSDRDWDTYRNHRVGFVFQSYNLIPHQSIIANVELALTLSGVTSSERRKRAKAALKRVGLAEHINKRPSQLSGGQMQRVAIARALVNDPDIILADEPTGALDSKTSTQIMKLLKEVAKDRLVIMVTHNDFLARDYSTRIIELKDGKVLGDTNPFDNKENLQNSFRNSKKTNMSFLTALSLSLNNLMTKKGRTILTSFAGSIGIIGIALILSLSSGVQSYINRVEEETLTSYPITIDQDSIDLTSAVLETREKMLDEGNDTKKNKNKIYSNNTIGDTLSIMSNKVKYNNLEQFKKYIEDSHDLDNYVSSISYQYNIDLQLYKGDIENGIVKVNPNTVLDNLGMNQEMMQNSSFSASFSTTSVFSKMFENEEINKKMYQVVSGRMPKDYNEVVLLVDENNQVSDFVLYALGLKDQTELKDYYAKIMAGEKIETTSTSYDYNDLIGLSYKLLLNTDYYVNDNGIWIDKSDDLDYLKEKLNGALEIKIVGIIKPNENSVASSTSMGKVLYTKGLEEYVINKTNEAEIVKEQKERPDINVITGLEFSDEEFSMNSLSANQKMYLSRLSPEELADIVAKYKEQASATYDSTLIRLGSVELNKPMAIHIYAKDFDSKEEIKNIINDYNDKQRNSSNDSNVINYSDIVGMLISSVTGIVDMVSYVLMGFVSISLIVSSIMIGIITYISVLERTKEIGILRAIGASKKDVSRVFNAETLIVGLISGLIGIIVTIILNIPINIVIEKLAGVANISRLPLNGAIILILISVILTMIAGLIPSSLASKKDPVESLRNE